ncbi:MAG TPA: hypothetical protein VGK67_07690 [Myxococcales bacterium]|jgi:hypothetical protein
MVPDRNDPRWQALISAPLKAELHSFALKMLLTRLRNAYGRDATPPTLQACATELHSFFVRNEEIAREDLSALIGG